MFNGNPLINYDGSSIVDQINLSRIKFAVSEFNSGVCWTPISMGRNSYLSCTITKYCDISLTVGKMRVKKIVVQSNNQTPDVRSLRIRKGMSQAEVAKKAGLTNNSLSRIERGLVVPNRDQIEALASVLEVNANDLRSAQGKRVNLPLAGEGYVTKPANTSQIFKRQQTPPRNKWKVLDIFCGCGGLSYGFEQSNNFVVTGGIDLLEDRIRTFKRNHPYASAVAADLRSFSFEDLNSLSMSPDVVVGGPPCQGFSSIRPFRTLTENDPRNSLIEQFVSVVGTIKPKWFVFENVVGLFSHQKGAVFESLLESFREAGYQTDWKILNFAMFGLPQARERLVIVGSSDGTEFPWPKPTHMWGERGMAGKNAKRIAVDPLFDRDLAPARTVMDAIEDLPTLDAGEESFQYGSNKDLNQYAREMREGCESLSLHDATKHGEKMMEIIRLAGKSRADLPAGLTSSGFSSSYSRLDADRPSNTITVNFVHPASNRCIHPYQNRALTPREGARLQGFPDRFAFEGSRAEIVKQIGNAVPPLLGRLLADQLGTVLKVRHHEIA